MQGDPLHVLDAVTRVLPPSAWVQRLEWNGQTVRVVGFKNSDTDLVAAFRASPVFINPRVAASRSDGGQAGRVPALRHHRPTSRKGRCP